MDAWNQFRLMFKKFTLQRVLLSMEIFWPLVILIVLSTIRMNTPSEPRRKCIYSERQLPNAGMIPFIQSLICNQKNQCVNRDVSVRRQVISDPRIGAKVNTLFAYLVNLTEPKVINSSDPENTTPFVANVFDGLKSMTEAVGTVMNRPLVITFLNNEVTLKSVLRNPDDVVNYLVEEHHLLHRDVADTLLNSGINFYELYVRLNNSELNYYHKIVCDDAKLGELVLIPAGKRREALSKELCRITESQLDDALKMFGKQLDFANVIRRMSEAISVLGDNVVATAFADVAKLIDIVLKFRSLEPYIKEFPALKNLPRWIEQAVKAVEALRNDNKPDFKFLGEILDAFLPLLRDLLKAIDMWESARKYLHYLNVALEWIAPAMVKFELEELTFGDMFQRPTTMSEFLKNSLHLTDSMIRTLLSSRFNLDQTAYVLYKLSHGDERWVTYKRLFCEDPGLRAMLRFSNGTSSYQVDAIERAICRFNNTALMLELGHFNVEQLKEQFAHFNNNSVAYRVNFTEIITNGQDVVWGLLQMVARVKPLLKKIGALVSAD